MANNNATVAEQNARRAEQVAANNAQAKSMEARARLGKVKATQAASGVDVNTGSALDVQVGTRELGKLDTDTVFSNDLVKAYGYKSDAQSYRSQADLLRYGAQGLEARAGSEETSGYLKAGGTLLSSASSLPFGKWAGGLGDAVPVSQATAETKWFESLDRSGLS